MITLPTRKIELDQTILQDLTPDTGVVILRNSGKGGLSPSCTLRTSWIVLYRFHNVLYRFNGNGWAGSPSFCTN